MCEAPEAAAAKLRQPPPSLSRLSNVSKRHEVSQLGQALKHRPVTSERLPGQPERRPKSNSASCGPLLKAPRRPLVRATRMSLLAANASPAGSAIDLGVCKRRQLRVVALQRRTEANAGCCLNERWPQGVRRVMSGGGAALTAHALRYGDCSALP